MNVFAVIGLSFAIIYNFVLWKNRTKTKIFLVVIILMFIVLVLNLIKLI